MTPAARQSIKQRHHIVGDNARLNAALDIAMQVAPTEVTVLVVGENGSGKDVFAQIIHQLSARKHKPYIAINCGAIPEGTIDSELFGHEKGSFTSAFESRKGYFEEANGGIIFLDEIAEMPLATQSRLLRVLENGEFLRVGSSKVQKTDVRVVAATNKNLIDAIRQGKFREDLYFRLNTVTIQVPPLRERGTDLELLFRYFAQDFGARYGREPVHLTDGAVAVLNQYHWPGNVRELRNFVEKLTVLSPGAELGMEQLATHLPARENRLPILSSHRPDPQPTGEPSGQPQPQGLDNALLVRAIFEMRSELAELRRMLTEHVLGGMTALKNGSKPGTFPSVEITGNDAEWKPVPMVIQPNYPEANIVTVAPKENARPAVLLEESLSIRVKEKDLIARALAKYGNNRKKAAVELGFSERTLYRKIKSYGLDK